MYSGGGTGYTSVAVAQDAAMVGANNGIATTASVTLGASAAANLDLNGFNQSLAGVTKSTNGATIGNSSTTTDSLLTTTGTSNFAGVIQDTIGSGTRKVALAVNGGSLTLTGTNTYTGATTISGGTLALGAAGSIANSSSIIVGASTTFNVSAVTGGYTLASNQTISGTGTVTGAMSVSGTLSPGNSPGSISTGSETWLNGGDYNWQVLDAAGAAGTGFDQVAVTGTLDLSNLTVGGFNLNLWSLNSIGPDVNGNALNFNNAIDQSWIILTTTTGITGFDAADFIINVGANNGTDGFSNALGGGAFSLGTASNNLVLNFTAVPEPNVAALLGGLGMLSLLRRRR
jgi:autotransporter-associated beta strand protein